MRLLGWLLEQREGEERREVAEGVREERCLRAKRRQAQQDSELKMGKTDVGDQRSVGVAN